MSAPDDTSGLEQPVSISQRPKIDTVTRLREGITVSNDELPMESTPRERRRYAILQAAATVVAGHWPYIPQRDVITDIIGLLEEIEKRET